MPNLLIQTDVWSLVGVLAAAFATGFVLAWILRQNARKPMFPVNTADDQQGLYLVFSRLSHRLKTAGEVIRGHLHGFTDDLPRDAERWRVARRAIAGETDSIDSLVGRLDLVVRLGLAEQPLVMEPVNIPRLLEDLMVELGPAADSRGVLLGGVVSSQGGVVPHITADVMAIKEVFSNLLENAVNYNPRGTEVVAEVRHLGDHVLVRITDNGKGIQQDWYYNIQS